MPLERRARYSEELEAPATTPMPVGRSSLTQRHVAKVSPEQRILGDALMDGVWAVGPVQLARDGHSGLDDAQIQAAAGHGISGAGGALPHLAAIQRSFGDHDVSGVTAHVGGAAREASDAMGAHAYATGDHVAFAESPSLFLVAHEAAHVVQQRAGVHLSSAVGQAGDSYEQHADAVAARVVAGESAADLLGPISGGGGTSVQRKETATLATVLGEEAAAHVEDAQSDAERREGRDDDDDEAQEGAVQRRVVQRDATKKPGKGGATKKVDGPKPGDKKHIELAPIIARLKGARGNVLKNVTSASDYLTEAIPVVDAMRGLMNEAAANYGTAHSQHQRITDTANKAAAFKESILDIALGFGIGVGLGLLATAIVPATVGAALVTASTELVEAAAAFGVGELGVTKQPTAKALALTADAVQGKHYARLVELYRGLAVTGQVSTAASLVLHNITYLEGQARLLDTKGGKADITAEDVVRLAEIAFRAEAYVSFPVGPAEHLREQVEARKDPPGAWEMERYIWVYWMSQLGHMDEDRGVFSFGDTDILDNDEIEDYLHGSIKVLGSNSLLGVDFGGYTSESDERDAVRAAVETFGEWAARMRKYLE